MDPTELLIRLALVVACVVAASVLFVVWLGLGLAHVGDGSGTSAGRLNMVSLTLVTIVIVVLLIVALFILMGIVGPEVIVGLLIVAWLILWKVW